MQSTASILMWKAEGRAEGMAEGLAKGMLEARREDLMKVLRVKFQILPPELTAYIRGCDEMDVLKRFFEAALAANTLEAFGLLIRER
jgi:hypothetical protein